MVLQIFVIFFLTLTISAYLFYSAEHSAQNSQITTMGDALWWTIQTASTSTFGPNAITPAGRIVGRGLLDQVVHVDTPLSAGRCCSRRSSFITLKGYAAFGWFAFVSIPQVALATAFLLLVLAVTNLIASSNTVAIVSKFNFIP